MDQTNDFVAETANDPDAISLDNHALIGVVDGPEGRKAMLYSPDGTVDIVFVGDLTVAGRVAAIGEGSVTLDREGERVTLAMPVG